MTDAERYEETAILAGFLDPMEDVVAVKRSIGSEVDFWILVKDREQEGFGYVSAWVGNDYSWSCPDSVPLEEAEEVFNNKA